MPRPINELLHSFFEKNELNQIICTNGSCGGKVLNKHSGNLERHIKAKHLMQYQRYMEQKTCQAPRKVPMKVKISCEVNTRNVECALVELFTKNGRPLGMIHDRAFKHLVQPVLSALNMILNEQNTNDQIVGYFNEIKADIIKDLRGKLITLKIDVVTKQDLTLLGINVQYIKNQSIVVKTLGIREQKSADISKYFKRIVLAVLIDYEIGINQILSITTNNEPKMLQAVSDINDFSQKMLAEEDNSVMEDSSDAMSYDYSAYNITSICCSTHTLQLCANDVFQAAEIKTKIDKCRHLADKLRNQTNLDMLNKDKNKKPILDCVTQWTSTFDMLERLLDMKEIINLIGPTDRDLKLSNEIWNFMGEFIEAFQPLYTATLKLQSESLCFSEIYIIMMDLIFQVENMPANNINMLLKAALNTRKSLIFNNNLFNAAVFLDPRIRVALNADQLQSAKEVITFLHKRIASLKDNCTNTHQLMQQSDDDPLSSSSRISTTPRSLSEFLQSLEPVPMNESVALELSHIENDLMFYEHQSRLSLDSNVLEYWSKKNNALSTVANVVLAIPSTQASVGRLLSSLDYMLSDKWNGSSSFNLENILLLRINGEFKYED